MINSIIVRIGPREGYGGIEPVDSDRPRETDNGIDEKTGL